VLDYAVIGLIVVSLYGGMRLGYFAPGSTKYLKKHEGPVSRLERWFWWGVWWALVVLIAFRLISRWVN